MAAIPLEARPGLMWQRPGEATRIPEPSDPERRQQGEDANPDTLQTSIVDFSVSSDATRTPAENAPQFSPPEDSLSRSLCIRLYTSHFLSTWNSRLFEFGSVLFLASIFPDTLLPMSIYALVRNGSAILFSPAVGKWIDQCNRLTIVRISIIGQRLAVAGSCGIFWMLDDHLRLTAKPRLCLFVLVVALACVEKLCSILNLVAIERDWVVVISEGLPSARHLLNARMRRIDLICKLLGPLAISLIAGASTMVAIWVTLGMNCSSVFVEYICIARVYKMAPELQRSNEFDHVEAFNTGGGRNSAQRSRKQNWLFGVLGHLLPIRSLPFYFSHPALLPSFSLALLYFTVLSFSGQMITFLLSAGYSSIHVGIARTISTIFELSATWAAPRLVEKIGAVRGGIWFLSWQMVWLAGGASWFFADTKVSSNLSVFAVSGLVGGVILSRIGLWGFDLCAQNIIQDEVDPNHHGVFSAVEASFQNLFELLSYVSTVIFSRPNQFRWSTVMSVAATYLAGAVYAAFVRRRRGHLLHAPQCIKPKIDDVELSTSPRLHAR